MRPSPLDIRKQEFHTRFRGYDPDEVNATLTVLAQQWDEMEIELRRRDDRLTQLEVKLQHYERVEEALQQAIETARESSRQAMATAEAKAEQIRIEAHETARGIKRDAETERLRLRQETQAIAARRKEIVARLRAFLMSEMEMLAHFEGEDPVGFIRLMPPGAGQLPAAPSDGLGPYVPDDDDEDLADGEPLASIEDLADSAAVDEVLAEVPLAPLDLPPALGDEPTYADDADEGLELADGEPVAPEPEMPLDEAVVADEPIAEIDYLTVPDETFDVPPFSDEPVVLDIASEVPVDEALVVDVAEVLAVETEVSDVDEPAFGLPGDAYDGNSGEPSMVEPQAVLDAPELTPPDVPPGSPWGDAPPLPPSEEKPAPRVVSLSDIFPGARSATELPPLDTPESPEPIPYDAPAPTWSMEPPAPEPTLWADEQPTPDSWDAPVTWDTPPPTYDEVYMPQPGASWEPPAPEPTNIAPPPLSNEPSADATFAETSYEADLPPLETSYEAELPPIESEGSPEGLADYTVSSEFAFDPAEPSAAARPEPPPAPIPSVWSDDLLDQLMPPVAERSWPVEEPYTPPPAAPAPSPAAEVAPEPLPAPRTVTRTGYAVESLLGDLSEVNAPFSEPSSPQAEPPAASASGEEIERIRRLLSGLG